MADGASVVEVRNFLNKGATKPVEMKEMAEFWKSCSDDEKVQFTKEARELMA